MREIWGIGIGKWAGVVQGTLTDGAANVHGRGRAGARDGDEGAGGYGGDEGSGVGDEGAIDAAVFADRYRMLGWHKGPFGAREVQAAVRRFWIAKGAEGAAWLLERIRDEPSTEVLHAVAEVVGEVGRTDSAALAACLDVLDRRPTEEQEEVALVALRWMAVPAEGCVAPFRLVAKPDRDLPAELGDQHYEIEVLRGVEGAPVALARSILANPAMHLARLRDSQVLAMAAELVEENPERATALRPDWQSELMVYRKKQGG